MNDQYAIRLHWSRLAGYPECISHTPTATARFVLFVCLFVSSEFNNKCIVTLQRTASWETAGEVDGSDAYLRFPSDLYSSGKFFGNTTVFACVYPQHTTNYFLAKLVCTAIIVCRFENSQRLQCASVGFQKSKTK